MSGASNIHVVHEAFSSPQYRVVIVYKDGRQETQVLIARGTNPVGETQWRVPTTIEEYKAVLEAWAEHSRRQADEHFNRRHPRGGPDDR